MFTVVAILIVVCCLNHEKIDFGMPADSPILSKHDSMYTFMVFAGGLCGIIALSFLNHMAIIECNGTQ